MNCTKCQNTGWLCEEHPSLKQNHFLNFDTHEVKLCNGAGMPCTCDAFPHKKKPREFWIIPTVWSGILTYASKANADEYTKTSGKESLHVREVIESPTDAEIEEAGRYNLFTEDGRKNSDVTADWMAGARWAIAKLTGGSK